MAVYPCTTVMSVDHSVDCLWVFTMFSLQSFIHCCSIDSQTVDCQHQVTNPACQFPEMPADMLALSQMESQILMNLISVSYVIDMHCLQNDIQQNPDLVRPTVAQSVVETQGYTAMAAGVQLDGGFIIGTSLAEQKKSCENFCSCSWNTVPLNKGCMPVIRYS